MNIEIQVKWRAGQCTHDRMTKAFVISQERILYKIDTKIELEIYKLHGNINYREYAHVYFKILFFYLIEELTLEK